MPKGWKKQPRRTKPKAGRCNHKRRDQTYCWSWPVKGADHGKCRWHRPPDAGIKNVHYRHGKRSKKESLYLREKAEAMLQDANLLNLDTEVALSRVREEQLLESFDDIPLPATYKELQAAWKRFRKASVDGSDTQVAKALAELEELIVYKDQREAVWDRIIRHQEHRRKLIDTERKYRQQNEGMAPIETIHGVFDVFLRLMTELRHRGELTPLGMTMIYEAYRDASRRWREPMKITPAREAERLAEEASE